MDKFRKRIEAIFRDYEFREYGECPELGDFGYGLWVEFTVFPKNKSFPEQTCDVPFVALRKLAKLLGTGDIRVSGWDLSEPQDGSGSVAYVVAYGVNFR